MEKGQYEDVLEELWEDDEGIVSGDRCAICRGAFDSGRYTCSSCEREVCSQCLATSTGEVWAVCAQCGRRR